MRQMEHPLPLVAPLIRMLARRELLKAVSEGHSEATHEVARLFLAGLLALSPEEIAHPAGRSAFCREWAGSREPRLRAWLLKAGWVADSPPAVRVLSLLLQDRGQEIALGGDRWAPALVLACVDPDPELAGRALEALERLPDREAREAACAAVLETSFPPEEAIQVLVRQGWAPREEGARALFYFLTGQADKFDALDYDQSLLQAAYAEMAESLRPRVVRRIRDSGRADLVKVVQSDEPRRRLHGLTPSEYEAVVQVLEQSGRWPELWQMVFTASPEWSAEILGILQREGFEPPPQDRPAYHSLLELRPTRGRHLKLQLPAITRNASHQAFEAGVRGLAFAPDGKLLAAGGKSDQVLLWDPYSGRQEGALGGHAGVVTALAFSPDSRLLATGGSDHGAYLWDPRRQRLLRRIFPEEAPVGTLTMAFSATGRYLAVGGWETGLLLDLEHDRQHLLEGHSECIVAVAFDPGERFVATASWDHTVRVWPLPGLGRPHVLRGHNDHLISLAFSHDGEHLVTVAKDGRIQRWRATGRFSEPELLGFHQPPIWKMACHPQGRLVATSGADGSIRLWGDVGKVTLPPRVIPVGRTTDMAFSSNGDFLARSTHNGDFSLWQMARRSDGLQVVPIPRSDEREEDEGMPDCLAFAPDGRTLAVGYQNGLLAFWSLFQTKPVGRMDQADLARIEDWLPRLDERERPAWEFVAELIRHHFRHAVELGEATGAFLDEFAIDLD